MLAFSAVPLLFLLGVRLLTVNTLVLSTSATGALRTPWLFLSISPVQNRKAKPDYLFTN